MERSPNGFGPEKQGTKVIDHGNFNEELDDGTHTSISIQPK